MTFVVGWSRNAQDRRQPAERAENDSFCSNFGGFAGKNATFRAISAGIGREIGGS